MKTLSIASAVVMFAGALLSAAEADNVKKVDILVMSDTPQLLEVRDGILEGLKARGYIEGKNLTINFKSAQANFGTAQQIARQFVGDAPDVIVPITTPTSQAVVAATKDIPIVFSTVTDPLAAKLVPKLDKPGGNVSGVADPVPIEQMLTAIKQLVPNLKKLGFVYDPSLPNSIVTTKAIKEMAPKFGFETVDSPAMGLNNVPAAGQALVGKVDAIFVPNDTTVYAVFEALVKIAQDGKVPLFSSERRSVERGAVATIGLDFKRMGVETANMVDKVLKGTKPGDLDVLDMSKLPDALSLYLNKNAAEKMGVTVPPEMLKRAAHVY
ncbi:MAG TPA: ABC transporter substrate-binding protein [Pseudolabrys sp.]|jgi:putative ABC transport system substrate-binding protein|nr:ABC transporter substrate-binding protein [Pseudolabrys sp.]